MQFEPIHLFIVFVRTVTINFIPVIKHIKLWHHTEVVILIIGEESIKSPSSKDIFGNGEIFKGING